MSALRSSLTHVGWKSHFCPCASDPHPKLTGPSALRKYLGDSATPLEIQLNDFKKRLKGSRKRTFLWSRHLSCVTQAELKWMSAGSRVNKIKKDHLLCLPLKVLPFRQLQSFHFSPLAVADEDQSCVHEGSGENIYAAVFWAPSPVFIFNITFSLLHVLGIFPVNTNSIWGCHHPWHLAGSCSTSGTSLFHSSSRSGWLPLLLTGQNVTLYFGLLSVPRAALRVLFYHQWLINVPVFPHWTHMESSLEGHRRSLSLLMLCQEEPETVRDRNRISQNVESRI